MYTQHEPLLNSILEVLFRDIAEGGEGGGGIQVYFGLYLELKIARGKLCLSMLKLSKIVRGRVGVERNLPLHNATPTSSQHHLYFRNSEMGS